MHSYDPCPSALSTKKSPGLKIVRKRPSNRLDQTQQGPQDKTSILDSPQSSDKATQNSSSPNLVRKVQDWRDWTYTDGSLKKHKEGQDTGSGVYHPCLDISLYVNPRDGGITNIISRAELGAVRSSRNHSRLLPYGHR
jgi:hypothetical protein